MTTTKLWTQPNLADSIRRRLEILGRIKTNSKKQLAITLSAKDPVIWVNDFVWTYDPRITPATMPFDLFPRQVEFIRWLSDRYVLREDGLAEKSRDVGFTWLCAAFMVHHWLFHSGFKGTVGSRKESLVDRMGDPDTIFEKMRLILQLLPPWMLPSYQDSYMRLLNHQNGNSITGESGDNMGRGGRSSLYIIDEAAFIERPQKVDAAISQNSDVKIYVSTPNGSGNPFAQKRLSGAIPVFTFRWQDDPRKDQAWYQKQVDTLDPVIVASEIDIDYSASIEGIFIEAKWVRAAIDYPLSAQGASVTAGLDVATTGKNKNVFVVRQGNKAIAVKEWQGLNTTETTFKAQELIKSFKATHLNFDVDGVGAGVAGTLETTPNLGFTFTSVHGSGSPSVFFWVGENKTSKEKFYNKRAEHYGLLRERFRKTYEMVEGIAEYLEDELISIPNHATLIAQLSQPLRKFTSNGKILLESKDEMRRRGVESPDYADALMYAFIDPPDDWTGAAVVGSRRIANTIDW
ncbi:terminase large subunit domain-containing protein [Chroococcidiopsis sp.]|uniref:terminase large subunit domain-containing protein n=1 Tax=Chroococcidiopsis sp. TaxID=3088168 RepID=UPI003F2CFCB8